jgi:alpha-beta hydrolase superfamily lysophospholipase
MADPILDQSVLFYLGEVWHQSADVGEVLQTAQRARGDDPYRWPHEWRATSERVRALARASEAEGHALSASQAYLRAATYLRAALHRYPDPADDEVRAWARDEVECFSSYLRLSGRDAVPVEIPYAGTTLPGYFYRASTLRGRAPVIIAHQGRDAWAEDNKHIAEAANARGYHALLFDGPGMGKTLRLQGLPFRPDWDQVMTPVIDWLVARPDVDSSRLALIGLSMGGFLAPRAAAAEHRLKIVVANPGVYDWSRIYIGFLESLDPALPALAQSDALAFDQRLQAMMQQSEFLRWGITDSMWHHGVDSPSALLRDVARYRLDGLAGEITSRVLVVDAEAEQWGQSKQLFEALRGPKDFLRYTAAEAAQFHVQPGALAVATQRLFDWIDREL